MRCITSSAALFFALTQLVAANPAAQLHKRWQEFDVKHAWHTTPEGWELKREALDSHAFNMRVGLKQHRFDELLTSLHEVSDPDHPKYGQHLSKEEVDTLVAPHHETVSIVDSWLAAHGIDLASVTRENGGSSLSFKVTVEQASRMLNATYGVYHHPRSTDYVVRTEAYSLPRILHDHITVVTPTTYFGTMRSMRTSHHVDNKLPWWHKETGGLHAKRTVADRCVPRSCGNTTTTPECLRELYNTTYYIPQATKKNSIGVTGFLDQYANHEDLQTFWTIYRQEAWGTDFDVVSINGGQNNQSRPGMEAALDIQYTSALTWPTPNIFYTTGGSPPWIPDLETIDNSNEPYLEWLEYTLKQKKTPQTFSTSYGDNEQTVPRDYAIHVCNLFAQLGARGSSVLFPSGDYGVGIGSCKTNDGKNTTRFQPEFPSSCPYVTSVGGTAYTQPEVTVIFSGGGFSDYFPRPDWQKSVVDKYLKKINYKYKGMYDPKGRAYPDVAAIGVSYQIIMKGQNGPIHGTSASVPTFASIVSLLNDYRLARGKSALGWLNPMLYSKGYKGLTDITEGNNMGCGTKDGFPATTGWDIVTGLGTPNFGKLTKIIGDC